MPVTRICYIIGQLGKGGAEKQLLELVSNLDRTRFDPWIICLERDTQSGDFSSLRERIVSLDYRGRMDLAKMVEIQEILERLNPGIAHCFLTSANFYGLLASRWAQIPVKIVSERSCNSSLSRISRWIYSSVYRWADCVVANSQEMYFELRRRFHVPSTRLSWIPNGCRLSNESRLAVDRSTFGVRPDEFLVGTVSHLIPEKNIGCLIDAVASLCRQNLPLKCLIIGGGPLHGTVSNRIQRLGISQRCILAGHRNDALDLMRILDCFVLPSDREGMPNALMEAMSLQLPCIASDVGGVPDLIENGKSGLLFRKGDAAELALHISRIQGDPAVAAQLGVQARKRIASGFSIRRMVESYHRLYEDALQTCLARN